jgi:hypothetical protein
LCGLLVADSVDEAEWARCDELLLRAMRCGQIEGSAPIVIAGARKSRWYLRMDVKAVNLKGCLGEYLAPDSVLTGQYWQGRKYD